MSNAIGTDAIGPSFVTELDAAGLHGLPFTFGLDGVFHFDAAITDAQKSGIEAVFARHDPGNLNPNTAYLNAVNAGVTIASTSTPTIDGVYGCTDGDTANINVGQTAVLTKAFWGFYNKQDGTTVEMTADQFTALAVGIMGYVVALKMARLAGLKPGGKWVAPPATVTIA